MEKTWRLPEKEAVGKNQRAIIVVRTDGEQRDWSYHHVIDKPTTAVTVKSALAFALESGRLERRDTDFAAGPVTCAATGDLIAQKHETDTRHLEPPGTTWNAPGTHLEPTWHALTSAFVSEHGGWDAIETQSGRNLRWQGHRRSCA